MFIALIIFHVLVCLALILVVLLQSSKGEGLAGSAFGGGGGGISGAVFGGRGAGTFLSKATTVLAVVFMINCVLLAFMSSNRSGGAAATAAAPENATSVITREAQAERERALQQQQQQQQQAGDTSNALNLNISPSPSNGEEKPTTGAQQPTPSEGGDK